MRRKTNLHRFAGFKHCGGQKIFMIEGQGINSPAFTTSKAADNYRKAHGIRSHSIFSSRYTIIAKARSDFNRNYIRSEQ